ncbi:thiamine pyrophosphokinase [Streptococcus sp. F0442]|uniref:thiamine diphosphokinase n=1 Tax=Streptococcus sp. F0442 TaxID=999425 RepID=UPI00029923AB|nr:thiamine diphosphokinase [Streptococcus sp. F0442]EKS20468.1 thiamine pyrophosphokinase [Streptococcus sp. F0442]
MVKIVVVAGGDSSLLPKNQDIYLGVDGGCLKLLKQGLPLDIAVGDFDSVSEVDLRKIQAQAKQVVQSVPEKNDTDLELALKTVFEDYPDAAVTVYGAFGGRLDHFLSNIFLPTDPDLAPYMEQIQLVDEQNRLVFRPAGSHEIQPDPTMTYVGFMPVGQGRLEITGAKYPLHPENYFLKAMYGSNEFLDQAIQVSLDRGYLVIVYSKDRG